MIEKNGLSEYLEGMPVNADPPVQITWRSLDPSHWATELAERCIVAMEDRETVILCITGKAGSGKSTLGRFIRKQGLPGIPLVKMLVIDDGMAHLKWFGLLPRRIKYRCRTKDYLAPFASHFAGRRLLVYVNTTPEQRIDRCDILVRLRCADSERRSRLVARDPDGAERFGKGLDQADSPRVSAGQYFDLQTDHPAMAAFSGR